jgi:hypothetical protein
MADNDYMRSVRPMVANLAADADAQKLSTPEGVSFAADVLEDAELIFRTAMGQHGQGLSEAEKQVVSELHASVESIVSEIGPGDPFWEDSSLQSHPKWASIRLAARQALRRLDDLRGQRTRP